MTYLAPSLATSSTVNSLKEGQLQVENVSMPKTPEATLQGGP